MSNIIKSDFVSIMDHKKSIEVVDKNDIHIVNHDFGSLNDESTSEMSLDDELTRDYSEDSSHQKQAAENEKIEDTAESIIEDAKIEALKIIEKAKEAAEIEAEEIKTQAYNIGYEEAKAEAEAEYDKEQLAFEREREAFEEEYKNLVSSIEPKMIKLVIKLVENLVGYTAVEESVIEFILKKGFEEIELAGHITIKVSESDYDLVSQKQSELIENVSNQTIIEILIDYTLDANECVIETEAGTINCGLDTRLKGLKAELSLIQKSLIKD